MTSITWNLTSHSVSLEPLSSTMQVPGWILFNIQVNLKNKLAIEGHRHDRPQALSKSEFPPRGKSSVDPSLTVVDYSPQGRKMLKQEQKQRHHLIVVLFKIQQKTQCGHLKGQN